MLKRRTYSEDDGSTEANGWTDDFAVAWVLVGSTLEADDWEWKEVTHPGGLEEAIEVDEEKFAGSSTGTR